jgi:hypothetical protein
MMMHTVTNPPAARTRVFRKIGGLCIVLLLGIGSTRHAQAAATLLLEEPYSYDGTFAGTGHVAVYLSDVCASSPVVLRPCSEGESGIVLSRYDGISGYDWIAIPLIAYLYAVDRTEAVPLFSDPKLVAFLRDQYRRDYLESVAPDTADGGTPPGNWYELIGSAYDRTIYGFEIETSADQDALLIAKLNNEPNRQVYNFVKRNCADFVREVINFYYPHALHRSLIGDLGVTTPKQIAKMMVKYSHHHPELQSSDFLVPQVPGSVRRSKPVHGVLESVMAAKKYMVPLVVLHPYIGGGLLVEYFGHRRFDPGKNDPILDSNGQPDSPLTRDQRLAYLSRLNELSESFSASDPSKEDKNEGKKDIKNKEIKNWEHLQTNATAGIDTSGRPVLQVRLGDDLAQVGLSRANILSVSDSSEFAAKMLEARLRQELRSNTTRKTAHSDVEKDLALFQLLLSLQAKEVVVTPRATNTSGAQASADLQ